MRRSVRAPRVLVKHVLLSSISILFICGQINADIGCPTKQARHEVVCPEDTGKIPQRPLPMVPFSEHLLGIAPETEASAAEETKAPTTPKAEINTTIRDLLFSVRIDDSSDNAHSIADQNGSLFGERAIDEDSSVDDRDPNPSEKFHWKPAIKQSLILLGVQHGYALLAQEKTRRALKGPFIKDYFRSLKGLHGWDDGNRFFTNYIAHPMQGALTGFIFVQNHDRAKVQKFAESPQYWKDRLKTLVWAAAWSTQFELGPISQSSIGNLGMTGGMGYVDLVITPTVGTAWLLSEEAIDRYIIRHIETKSFPLKLLTRILLNPMRTVGNIMRFKEPWYRDRPFGH